MIPEQPSELGHALTEEQIRELEAWAAKLALSYHVSDKRHAMMILLALEECKEYRRCDPGL